MTIRGSKTTRKMSQTNFIHLYCFQLANNLSENYSLARAEPSSSTIWIQLLDYPFAIETGQIFKVVGSQYVNILYIFAKSSKEPENVFGDPWTGKSVRLLLDNKLVLFCGSSRV